MFVKCDDVLLKKKTKKSLACCQLGLETNRMREKQTSLVSDSKKV